MCSEWCYRDETKSLEREVNYSYRTPVWHMVRDRILNVYVSSYSVSGPDVLTLTTRTVPGNLFIHIVIHCWILSSQNQTQRGFRPGRCSQTYVHQIINLPLGSFVTNFFSPPTPSLVFFQPVPMWNSIDDDIRWPIKSGRAIEDPLWHFCSESQQGWSPVFRPHQ